MDRSVSDLPAGTLIMMRSYVNLGVICSSIARHVAYPLQLYVIIEKSQPPFTTIGTYCFYVTLQGIIRLYVSDFVNSDNRVLL